MGGFVDPFVPEPAWPQDAMFMASSWPGGSASSLANPAARATYLGAAAAAAPDLQDPEFHLQNQNGSATALVNGGAKEMMSPVEQFLIAPAPHLPDDLNFDVDSVLSGGTPCAISLADSGPVVCSSNDSSGSEQSGLPPFLLGLEQPPAAWAASTFPQISSLAGEETSQSFGFGGAVSSNDDLLRDGNKYAQLGNVPSAPLQLPDDVEFDTFFRERVVTARVSLRRKDQNAELNTGKMLSFTPGLGQQLNTTNFGDLQLSQKEFSCLHHLNLSGQQLSSFNATGATHNSEQSTEVSSGKTGLNAPPFMIRPEVANGAGAAGSGAPKPRVRARRGQATDPHSIAERLRREKISDRMKNLQELVPNSNRTDKASMLEEIIEYVRFLQLQVKVLSMSRLGATEAVVPLLTESHTESSGDLLLSPRPGSGSGRQSSEAGDGAAFEQEVAQLLESNMTTAMQYLQSKGLCLMPIALASAISDHKGTSSAAVQPQPQPLENGEMLRAVKPLGSPIQGR